MAAGPSPSAYFGLGIELKLGTLGATPTYTLIKGCHSFTGPGKTRDTVDVTSHSSPSSYREFISGLRDGGTLTFDLNWLFNDTEQLALEASYEDDSVYPFRMDFPMATADNQLDFKGFVTDMTWNGPIDAQVTRSVTIKITGPITVGTAP